MTTAGSPAEEIMDLVDAYAHVYHSDEESYPPRPDAKRPPTVTGTLAHVKQVMTETRVTQIPHPRHSRERGNPSQTGCTTMTPDAVRHAPRPNQVGNLGPRTTWRRRVNTATMCC